MMRVKELHGKNYLKEYEKMLFMNSLDQNMKMHNC